MSRARFDLLIKDLSLDMTHVLKQFAHFELEHSSLGAGHPMLSAGKWQDISHLPIIKKGGEEALKAAISGKFLPRNWSTLGWEDFCVKFEPWQKQHTRDGKLQLIACLENLQLFLECIFSEVFADVFAPIVAALKDSLRPMRFFHDIFVAATIWGAIGRYFYGIDQSLLSVNGQPQRIPLEARRVLEEEIAELLEAMRGLPRSSLVRDLTGDFKALTPWEHSPHEDFYRYDSLYPRLVFRSMKSALKAVKEESISSASSASISELSASAKRSTKRKLKAKETNKGKKTAKKQKVQFKDLNGDGEDDDDMATASSASAAAIPAKVVKVEKIKKASCCAYYMAEQCQVVEKGATINCRRGLTGPDACTVPHKKAKTMTKKEGSLVLSAYPNMGPTKKALIEAGIKADVGSFFKA
jgi:hypothetical protein